MTKHDPWAGGFILPPVAPLVDVLARVQAARANPADPMARHYAKDDVYIRMYAGATDRLSQKDMLSLNRAAKKLGISPADYRDLAAKGEALLIRFEGKEIVPAWSIDKNGRIDALKCDIAREFALEGIGYFKFLDFFKFMTEETVDIAPLTDQKKLKTLFSRAGFAKYDCQLSVNATMLQLADQRQEKPEFFGMLIRRLDCALTHGGWDASGGLSRFFRDKYNIPGLTLDEQRQGASPASRGPGPT